MRRVSVEENSVITVPKSTRYVLPIAAMLVLATGCESRVGTAAVVDGHKISEQTVDGYLTAGGPPAPPTSGTPINARAAVVNILIQNRLFPRLIAQVGGGTGATQLAAARATVLGGQDQTKLNSAVAAAGLTSSFADVVLANQELTVLFEQRVGTQAAANAALAKFKTDVSLSPRYGTFSKKNLGLGNPGANQIPSVVTFSTPLPGEPSASP